MSLKNSGPERSFSSHDMSQTLWEIPRAQPTTDYLTSVPFSLWRGYNPPQGSSPNLCSHSVFLLPCVIFLYCISPEVMYHRLPSSKNWPSETEMEETRLLPTRTRSHTYTNTRTQTHNAHSFRFKHVNCFPSVLVTPKPWKSSYRLWRSSAGSKEIPELKPRLKHVNLSPLFRSFKPLTAKHNPVQLFQRECVLQVKRLCWFFIWHEKSERCALRTDGHIRGKG